jgi:hypothetical protein
VAHHCPLYTIRDHGNAAGWEEQESDGGDERER